MAKLDIAQEVTDKIISILETGAKPWEKPWASVGGALPKRHNHEPYRGINILLLWNAADEAGYLSPYWMTYKQAQEKGGQVRKDQKSTMVVYYGTAKTKEENRKEDDEPEYRFLKKFRVFNADQIDGLPESYYVKSAPVIECSNQRISEWEAFVSNTGAEIRHGGNRAYYQSGADFVKMPELEQFKDSEYYYSTLAHELTHWTKHKKRLDRSFGKAEFGNKAYAKEELVAEIGSAMLGAELGLRPAHINDHAAYISSWLKVLKNDKRFIFKASSKAQQAVDYLQDLQTEHKAAA